MNRKSTKPLKLVEGWYYRTRSRGIIGPASKSTRHPDYPWRVGDWTYDNNGGWLLGREDERDLIERVPSPKSKPEKKPQAKRVPNHRVFRDSITRSSISVGIDPAGRIWVGDLTLSKRTARALGEYLIALADRSGK